MADTRTIWKQRVASWRASGESAERFAVGRGFASSTLKWWASQLRAESPARIVRVAQLVRSPAEGGRGAVVVEELDAHVRITIGPGADRETVETVLAFICSPKDRR
ncbi:MAG: IS66 family insertion sequence element accessory protein TnpA [Kofleriaceae bacterium]